VGALFGAGAFAGVTVPVEIHRLGRDRVLRRPFHGDNIARLMGNRARLAVHPGAHHFAFIAPFPAALVAGVGAPARDPPGFDRRAFLSRIDRQIVDFFDRALPGRRSRSVDRPARFPFPGRYPRMAAHSRRTPCGSPPWPNAPVS